MLTIQKRIPAGAIRSTINTNSNNHVFRVFVDLHVCRTSSLK